MAIRPISDAIKRAEPGLGPAAPPANTTGMLQVDAPKALLAPELVLRGPLITAVTAGPKSRPSISEIVDKWHLDAAASAPEHHHRDRGEWFAERLPLLVSALQAREA